MFMAMDKAVGTALLLKDYSGEQARCRPLRYFVAPIQKRIFRGELLFCISKNQGKYQVASDPSVTLQIVCKEDTAPLTGVEYELLITIKSHEARYTVYKRIEDGMEWGLHLTLETCVHATLPSKLAIPTECAESVIRYIGPLSNEKGIHFGVEIIVSRVSYYITIYSLVSVCTLVSHLSGARTSPLYSQIRLPSLLLHERRGNCSLSYLLR